MQLRRILARGGRELATVDERMKRLRGEYGISSSSNSRLIVMGLSNARLVIEISQPEFVKVVGEE